MLASRWVAQLAQRFGFDLTNPLTGNVELFTNLLKGVVGIHVDTEAHAQYFGFTCCEAAEYIACRFFEALNGGNINWRLHSRVFDEITQMRVFVITDRGFHGDRLFSDLQYLADFIPASRRPTKFPCTITMPDGVTNLTITAEMAAKADKVIKECTMMPVDATREEMLTFQ